MIQKILEIIRHELSDYITSSSDTDAENPVVLGNIGLSSALGGNESYMQDRVVISLVNVMEEITLKNSSAYHKHNSRHDLSNPPEYLNLYLLFSANYNNQSNTNSDTAYTNSMLRLSQVIAFFQGKSVFTVKNSPVSASFHDPMLQDLRVKMELYSLTFEQVNHLWGSLGGKQVPFVMYKAGIVPVRRDHVTGRGEHIKDIQASTSHLKQAKE